MTPDEKAHYYGRMEKNFPQFLKAMERLVAVPSYLKEDDDYPHVPAIKKVLDETMALMKDLGYRTYADPDGYYGWAEIGEGDTLIGVLAVSYTHLDVYKRQPGSWNPFLRRDALTCCLVWTVRSRRCFTASPSGRRHFTLSEIESM